MSFLVLDLFPDEYFCFALWSIGQGALSWVENPDGG
jgi:hypothetical protein